MAMSRREFLAWGAATGAVAAGGVMIPVALIADGESEPAAQAPPEPAGTTTTTQAPVVEAIPALVTLYPKVRVAGLSDLAPHSVVDFHYPTEDTPASLFKLERPAAGGVGPDGDIVAYTTLCTHMGCPLVGVYNPDHGVLGPCGCHFTTFDLTKRGQVVIGQATEDLPQVLLEVDGDDIFAVATIGIAYGFRDNLADAVVVEGI